MNETKAPPIDLQFQRHSHDKRYSPPADAYYTGPTKDLTPAGRYKDKWDRDSMRRLLKENA